MATLLLMTLAASLSVQGGFFAVAARYRTDKVTDLSYGLSFVVLTFVLVGWSTVPGAGGLLAAMIILWALRLATYLFYRIFRMKRDPRFDGIRESFPRFLRFWFLQGLVVWVVMLPATLWFARPSGWSQLMIPGLLIWSTGLVIETVADLQKFRRKSRVSGADRWMSSGLWRYSRHPNYFGELLCWWGIFLFVAPGLGVWSAPAALGPTVLTYLLVRVTGIPVLEDGADRKWGADPRYRDYKQGTPTLVPWPVRINRSVGSQRENG